MMATKLVDIHSSGMPPVRNRLYTAQQTLMDNEVTKAPMWIMFCVSSKDPPILVAGSWPVVTLPDE
jgi:hypothetical protein